MKSRGAGGTWDEWNIIRMCRLHHIESGQLGWHRFAEKYPKVMEVLDQKGWMITWDGIGKLSRK